MSLRLLRVLPYLYGLIRTCKASKNIFKTQIRTARAHVVSVAVISGFFAGLADNLAATARRYGCSDSVDAQTQANLAQLSQFGGNKIPLCTSRCDGNLMLSSVREQVDMCVAREDVSTSGGESADTADVGEGRNRDVCEDHGLVRILQKR